MMSIRLMIVVPDEYKPSDVENMVDGFKGHMWKTYTVQCANCTEAIVWMDIINPTKKKNFRQELEDLGWRRYNGEYICNQCR